MSSSIETTQRFFRPADAGRARRNYRRIQVQRLFALSRNVLIVAGVVIGSLALYRHTQSGPQFAVKTIEIDGAVHTPQAALEAITRHYVGLNLFKVDIGRVRRDLRALPWVRHVDIEEKVPDTLRIRIVERTPVALLSAGETSSAVQYVDDEGVAFAQLSPAVGDSDLPLIVIRSESEGPGGAAEATNAALRAARPRLPTDTRGDILRCINLLRDLHARDLLLYSRVSEVRPVAPRGFAIFDRELGACVYANGGDLSARWRDLAAIAAREQLGAGSIEYADLRFDRRIIIKPLHAATLAAAPVPTDMPTRITN